MAPFLCRRNKKAASGPHRGSLGRPQASRRLRSIIDPANRLAQPRGVSRGRGPAQSQCALGSPETVPPASVAFLAKSAPARESFSTSAVGRGSLRAEDAASGVLLVSEATGEPRGLLGLGHGARNW